MSNLLDKASIILTPTAYNNGEALCVKPSDGSGDFDFSRNSAATRVNAQGLVENVQILSSNLVQNGDFSEEGVEEVSNGSFSQEGSQLIVNGDFSNGNANWTITGGNAEISNGKLNLSNAATYGTSINNSAAVVSGKTYLVEYTISDYVGGSSQIRLGSQFGTSRNSNGTFSEYIVANDTLIRLYPSSSNTTLSIDNVSVREVGQDWVLTVPEITIGNSEVNFNGVANASSIRQYNALTVGKIYKATYTISNYSQGGARIRIGGVQGTNRTSNGTYTEYITATLDTSVRVYAVSTTSLSITNISVKEVGQNWTLGSGWSIGEDKAIGTSATGVLYTNITITSSNKARIKADVDISGGGIQLRVGGVSLGYFYDNIDYVFTSNGNGLVEFVGQSFTGTITNISVIEITDDTNLPRINYEGFSYQDVLGSEEVVNGTFDTDLSGWLVTDSATGIDITWTVNGVSFITDGAGGGIQQEMMTIGKSYLIEFDYTSVSGAIKMLPYFTDISETKRYSKKIVATTTNISFYRKIGGTEGIIDNVSVKEYLGQEVVPDSGCGSWLFEPQSTNTINNSNSDFLAFNMDLVYNDVKSPDGTQNAFKATTTTTGGSQFRPNQTQITPSTFSIFLKYGNNQWYQVINSSATGFYANIDVQNGVFGTSGADTDNLSVKDYGNGWFRFSGTFTSASTTGSIRVYASSSSSAGWAGVSAPIGSYVYGYGFQVEALDYATSYIPTEGTQKTRNQDVCNNGGSLASINSTEGVLYAEIAALANDGTSRRITLSDGTASKVVMISFNNTDNQYRAYVLNGGIVFNYIGIFASLDFNKIALKFKDNDFALYVNGSKVATDLSGASPIGLNRLDFDGVNGALPFFGKTKALAVWKEALSDAELTELTTI